MKEERIKTEITVAQTDSPNIRIEIGSANELQPVFDYMKEELLKRNYIHADETYVKVIAENGKDSKSNKKLVLSSYFRYLFYF